MALDTLTAHDIAILAMERQWWQSAGPKEQAIRDELGMTPTRYYQRLNQIVEIEAALEYDAVTVNRLNRLRASKHGRRLRP